MNRQMSNKYLSLAISVFLVAVFTFSWFVIYGPFFEPMAYPGNLEPKPFPTIDGYYLVVDCLHTRIFIGTQSYPMTDAQITRECRAGNPPTRS